MNSSNTSGPPRSRLPSAKPSKLRVPAVKPILKNLEKENLPRVANLKRSASPANIINGKKVKPQVSNPVRRPVVSSKVQKRARRSVDRARKRLTSNSTANPSRSAISNAGSGPSVKPKKKIPAWDIKGQMAELKEEMASLKKNMEEKGQTAAAALEEKGVYSKKTIDLQNIVEEKENSITFLEMQIREQKDNLQRQRENYEIQTRILKENFERTLLTQTTEMETQKSIFKQENALLNQKVHKQEEMLTEKTKLNCDLETQISLLQEDLTKCKGDLLVNHSERKRLLNEVQELKGNIRVFVRARPLLSAETDEAEIDYCKDSQTLSVVNNGKPAPFKYDKVFGPTATQAEVFEELSMLTQSALDGYNICVFAYGQTGSGKTHTMEGPPNCSAEGMGVIQRTMQKIFEAKESLADMGWTYEFKVQQVEIYLETLRDLLKNDDSDSSKLAIKTVGNNGRIWVENLSEHTVQNLDDVMKLLKISRKRRATASTQCNNRSSRSHSVFILKIFATNVNTDAKMESWLNLVDLAGSERLSNSKAEGARLDEAKAINKSLQHLSKVIMEISSKSAHVSYRGSKLTFLLKDCIGGNGKTLMLVNINPCAATVNETMRTLGFASTVNQCNIGTAQKVVKM